MKRIFVFVFGFVALIGQPALAAEVPAYVSKAAADPARPQTDRDADALRLPVQTIAFAGVRPGMIVGELFPGGGYFTRLLSDVVGPQGKVYATENAKWADAASEKALAAEPGRGNVTLKSSPFGDFNFPEKLDLLWITQNYHDLHIAKYGRVDIGAFNRRAFAALKPGGTYFILDHQANPATSEDNIATLHRIEKAQIVREVTAAGFKLVGESDVLHRSSDDHTKSIFDVSVKGHTDQYLLKFQKP
jgi:predicted methyltransferase